MKRSLVVMLVVLILLLLLIIFIKSTSQQPQTPNLPPTVYSPSPSSSIQAPSVKPGLQYPIPMKASNNNPALKQYLPYETSNFLFEYDPARNSYLFHFKFDSNSSTPLPDQYDKAKQDATNFIQSKGIDINSLAIEWLYK